MEKKATNRKSKKEETPQVITTGIEEPALTKVSMLINIQTRGDEQNAERDNEQAQHNTVRQMDALDGCL